MPPAGPLPATSPDPAGGSAGLVLRPLRALRYDPARVGDLASVLCPPYDVIDERARIELEGRNPYNMVRLVLPRDEAGTGSRYQSAGRRLSAWRREQVLRPDPDPALYVYEETADGQVQRGLLGAVGLVPPEAGVVLPHEDTMAGPVADRLALSEATAANLEPIFLVYDGGGAAADLVCAVDDQEPLVAASTPDGVRHRLWAVSRPDQLEAVAGDLRPRRATIADGHHRYATYLQAQANRRAAGAGPGPWDFGLALLVDAKTFGPHVDAIHRVLPNLSATDAAELARGGFAVAELDGDVEAAVAALGAAAEAGPAYVVTDGARFWLLTDPDPTALAAALPADRSAVWRGLDVTVAHGFLVRKLWRLPDREGVVDFEHDPSAAIAAASGSGGTALLLNPTPLADVAAVAAAGERMPRKSTLFTPKPASGIVVRSLEE